MKHAKGTKTAMLLGMAFLLLASACGNLGGGKWNDAHIEQDKSLYPDYSSHSFKYEKQYDTTLGKAEMLGEGKAVIVKEEGPLSYRRPFEGVVQNADGEYDLRSVNAASADLSALDFNRFSFDFKTKWPETMPQGFDPAYILEHSKNPGLGIRALHEQGIDGTGVGIAIIDQALLYGHEEYKDNLMYYERVHCRDEQSAMHGPAVASIAVGKTVGTAPGATLYYIASTFGHNEKGHEFDASIMADCINRVVEINRNLPEGEKIRVISISRGYMARDYGYKELQEAIALADRENMFVVTTTPAMYYDDFNLGGMGRAYMSDPDDVSVYTPVRWILNDFLVNSNHQYYDNVLWVPIGSRTYASGQSTDGYEVSELGGLSWAVPWISGLYAMCCQIDPDITPQEFIDLCRQTSRSSTFTQKEQTYTMKGIINPVAVIERLQED